MIHKVKKLFVGKDAKTLLGNFLSLSSLQLIGMLLPLLTLPYVLRVLGFSNYGTIVLAASLVAYFQSLTDYSFKITATRDVAVFRSSQRKLSLIYSKVLTVKCIFLLLSCLIITLTVLFYPPFYEERLVFFLSMLMLLGYALFPEWFFQGIEKMKYITFLNLGIKIFFTLCIFVFIREEEDYWVYPLLQSAGYIGAGVVGQAILVTKFKLKFLSLKPRMIKQSITSNFPIFVNQFFPTLYNNTSTFLLGLITGTANVGIYDAIKKIVDLAISMINIVSRVFFPFLNRRRDAFGKYMRLMLAASGGLVVLIVLLHQLVFWYLNVDHPQAFGILVVLSVGILGLSVYDVFGINFFIVRRQDSLVMQNTLIASVLGLVLAYPLINWWGIMGAAVNLSLARILMGAGLGLKYIQKNNNINA